MLAKLKAVLDAAKQGAKYFWNTFKVYIVGAAGLLLFFEFRDFLISALVSSGKREMDDATKKDAQLGKEEDAAKAAAAAAQAAAQQELAPKPSVGDDWYEKKN